MRRTITGGGRGRRAVAPANGWTLHGLAARGFLLPSRWEMVGLAFRGLTPMATFTVFTVALSALFGGMERENDRAAGAGDR